MYYSLSENFAVTLYSLVMGAFLGVLYDALRLTRILAGVGVMSRGAGWLYKKKLPFLGDRRGYLHPRKSDGALSFAAFLVGDIVYSLIAAAAFSLFLFHSCRGVIRWMYILAAGIGFLIYRRTVSRAVVTVFEVAVFFARAAMRYIMTVVLFPIRLLLRLLRPLWRATVGRDISAIRRYRGKRRAEKIQKKTEPPPDLPVVSRTGRRKIER